ncbi:hypothetical protein MJ579_28210 [Klebsiella pneumoniae]|nr:hypothetical protein MJ579_28210 [Klebsiella pneumoniae]
MVKISAYRADLLDFIHYSVDLAMFALKWKIGFPNKWRNGYTALVIIGSDSGLQDFGGTRRPASK